MLRFALVCASQESKKRESKDQEKHIYCSKESRNQIFLEAITLEAIAIRVEAIARRLEAIARRLEAIASRLDAIAIRLEAIAISFPTSLGTT